MATVCDFSQTVFDSESHENAALYMGKVQMDFFSVCASVGERKYIHLSLDIVNALELAEAVCAPKHTLSVGAFLFSLSGRSKGF